MSKVLARDTHVAGVDEDGDTYDFGSFAANTPEEEIDEDALAFIGDHCWRDPSVEDEEEESAGPSQVAGSIGIPLVDEADVELEDLKVDELREKAKAAGVSGASSMNKHELIEAIEAAE